MEIYLEVHSKALNWCKMYYGVTSGDFNSKIGSTNVTNLNNIGNFGMGTRNQRGDQLINQLNEGNLYCLNTFSNKLKQKKWTRKGTDGKTRNEIDFILTNNTKIAQTFLY